MDACSMDAPCIHGSIGPMGPRAQDLGLDPKAPKSLPRILAHESQGPGPRPRARPWALGPVPSQRLPSASQASPGSPGPPGPLGP